MRRRKHALPRSTTVKLAGENGLNQVCRNPCNSGRLLFSIPLQSVATVLKAFVSGDFSFGLPDQARWHACFQPFPSSITTDTGFPDGAIVKNRYPVAAMDDLAAKVRAAGISRSAWGRCQR
jgi:hypothetical protein